jgi:hypothetical protein
MVATVTSMERSARRLGCLCLLVLGAVGLSPASAGAVRLGSSQIDETLTDFGTGCDGCMYVQEHLAGLPTRAPFSGAVRKWHVVSTNSYDYQLVVLHKKDNGKFKNVGESSVGSTTGAGEFEFRANMPIHKGEFVGLKGDSVAGIDNDTAKTLLFDPAPLFAQARKPTSSGADEYQYNAIVHH